MLSCMSMKQQPFLGCCVWNIIVSLLCYHITYHSHHHHQQGESCPLCNLHGLTLNEDASNRWGPIFTFSLVLTSTTVVTFLIGLCIETPLRWKINRDTVYGEVTHVRAGKSLPLSSLMGIFFCYKAVYKTSEEPAFKSQAYKLPVPTSNGISDLCSGMERIAHCRWW